MASKKRPKAKATEPVDRWLNLHQAAAYMGISKETMYRQVTAKTIPFYRIGKLYRFHPKQLDNWIISGRSK